LTPSAWKCTIWVYAFPDFDWSLAIMLSTRFSRRDLLKTAGVSALGTVIAQYCSVVHSVRKIDRVELGQPIGGLDDHHKNQL